MVERRKKIGILFSYSEGWIGGTYYFMNLVYALSDLSDDLKPELVIVSSNNEAYEKIKATGYPYLSYLSSELYYSIPEKIINKLSRLLLKRNLIEKTFSENQIDILFGYYEQLFRFGSCKKLFWIPDLQDKYYPQYLGVEVAKSREAQHKILAYTNSDILFSSNDSKNDFLKFYPNSICKTHVAQFAVTLPTFMDIDFSEISKKYQVYKPFFISPNQFWSHKNHLTVIKAVKLLKEQDKNLTVVFTGYEGDGNNVYVSELKNYVNDHCLKNNCLFLGFIDRKEQLKLVSESVAVIQPSLFEGWSTTVEDAKAMGKHIIMSNLKVHQEQMPNGSFFESENPDSLANLLIKNLDITEKETIMDYSINKMRFAEDFIKIIL